MGLGNLIVSSSSLPGASEDGAAMGAEGVGAATGTAGGDNSLVEGTSAATSLSSVSGITEGTEGAEEVVDDAVGTAGAGTDTGGFITAASEMPSRDLSFSTNAFAFWSVSSFRCCLTRGGSSSGIVM